MPDDDFPSSVPPSGAPPQHTTGGGMKWTPPSPEHLQRMLPAYEVTAKLGQGGMGAVYQALQKTLRRPVAIKIVPPEAADDEAQFIARFQNEALTMAKLNHPAIVSVYDFGQTAEGQLFFAMEFVDGTDVAQLIKAQGRLPPDHALAITAHVCDALAYAHAHGVIHRDIKPANILINKEGRVKVADFGLAKLEDPSLTSGLTKSHMALGTPDFVAPEALTLGVTVDHRADLYAIGVMLYQMLTGEIPRGMFQMPSEKVGSDPRFDAIIRKAMQTDRDLRYQTAQEIRDDLDRILSTPLMKAGDAQGQAAVPQQHVPQRGPRGPSRPAPQQHAPEPPAPAKSKAGLFIGLAAAVVVVIGAVIVFSGKEKPKPVTQPPTPVASASTPTLAPKPVAKAEPKAAPAPKSVPNETASLNAPTPSGNAKTMEAPAIAAKAAPAPMPAPVVPPAMSPTAPATPAQAPADPVSAKLASLEKTFLDAYEKQAGAAHKTAVADLNAKFAAALDRSITAVSQKGNLDEALALRNEKNLIQSSGAVPEEDAADTPESLKTLRKTWRASMAALLANRDKAAAPLHAAYDRALATYQDELTRASKLDEATRVKAVRDHLTAQREAPASAQSPAAGVAATTLAIGTGGKSPVPIAPTAPPLSADKILPPPPKATQEEVRALCEWAIKKGGEVRVMENGAQRTVDSLDKLPKGRITLAHFYVYELSFEEKADERKWFTLLGRVPEVESMFFHKNPGKLPIEDLRGLTKLKSLHLTPTAVDDAAFAHLAGLKNLETLNITYFCRQFTGTGLGYISENLRELGTDSKTISAEGLAYLPRFKKLRRLVLSDTPVTDAMLTGLAALTELEELEVQDTKLDGSFLSHLPAISKLKRLNLGGIKTFKPEHLKHLAKLKNLEFLGLPPVDPGPESLAAIAGLDRLLDLGLVNNAVFTGESFKGLKGFKSLTRLNLHTCPVTDAALEAVSAAIPELKSVEMTNSANNKATITAEGISRSFSRLRLLTAMNFHGERTTDEWTPHIAQLKGLTYLMLTGARVTDQGLPPLMKLPLGYLRLDGTQVTDAAIPILKTCPTLNNVPVGGTKMTDAGKAELRRVLDADRAK